MSSLKRCRALIIGVCASWLASVNGVCIVPKCCPLQQSIPKPGKGCQNSTLNFEPEFWNGVETLKGPDTEILNVIIGDPCLYGKFLLEPYKNSIDEFHILCNGSLLVPFQSSKLYAMVDYCLETFSSQRHGNEESVTLPLLCYPPEPPPQGVIKKVAMAMYPVGLLISVPFLVLTAVVFTAVPDLRSTQGNCLSCHNLSLAVAYVLLASVQLYGSSLSKATCVTLAFVIQLAFLSSFVWLNIICIDTWWRLRTKLSWRPHLEHLRFLWYSVYALGLPLLLTMVSLFLEMSPIVPNAYLKPNFGMITCWFKSRSTVSAYLHTPIILLLVTNVWLLYESFGYVRATVDEEQGLYPQNCSNNTELRMQMFKHSLILFVVMGLNWILQALSLLVRDLVEVWVVTDTLNTLQGLIIYFVFIVRVPYVRERASTHLAPVCDGLFGPRPAK